MGAVAENIVSGLVENNDNDNNESSNADLDLGQTSNHNGDTVVDSLLSDPFNTAVAGSDEPYIDIGGLPNSDFINLMQ
jgi:hypothetical protein